MYRKSSNAFTAAVLLLPPLHSRCFAWKSMQFTLSPGNRCRYCLDIKKFVCTTPWLRKHHGTLQVFSKLLRYLLEVVGSTVSTAQIPEQHLLWRERRKIRLEKFYHLHRRHTSAWNLRFKPQDFATGKCGVGSSRKLGCEVIGFALLGAFERSKDQYSWPGILEPRCDPDNCFYLYRSGQKSCRSILWSW